MSSLPQFPTDVAKAMGGFFAAPLLATMVAFAGYALLDLLSDVGRSAGSSWFLPYDVQSPSLWSKSLDGAVVAAVVSLTWFVLVRRRSRALALGAVVGLALWLVFWAAVMYLTWYVPEA